MVALVQPTALQPGSVAFVAFQSDGNRNQAPYDQFGFVLLQDVNPGTQILFTNAAFRQHTGRYATGEHAVRWTADTFLSAGTVVRFTSQVDAVPGTFTFIDPATGGWTGNTQFNLSTSGDQISAIQVSSGGVNGPTGDGTGRVNLATVNFAGTSFLSNNTGNSSETSLPTGLTVGETALSVGNFDNGYFTLGFPGFVSPEQFRAIAANPANWVRSETPFTSPIPAAAYSVLNPITGGTEAEVIVGTSGNDVIQGRGGADTIDGGAGVDFVSYESAASGVRVWLGRSPTGSQAGYGDYFTGDAAGDVITNVEGVIGSRFNDTLRGGEDGVSLTYVGGAGDDVIVGYAADDTVSYAGSTQAVRIELFNRTTTQLGGGTERDYIVGMENAVGSAFADRLYGDAGNNVLTGGMGNDTIYGLGGSDTVSYADARVAVRVDLAAQVGTVGTGNGAERDLIYQVENVTGSRFADRLYGDAGVNVLAGGLGNDTIYGLDGADLLQGEGGDDALIGGNGTDSLTGGAGVDRFYFVGTETGGADTLTDFVSGTDKIYVRARDATTGFGTTVAGTAVDLFTGAGDPASIFAGATGQAFGYDIASGALYFDADGSGLGAAIHIATLAGAPSLQASDFVIYTG